MLKVELPTNRRNSNYKGFAFVSFESEGAARLAMNCSYHRLRRKDLYVTKALKASEASKMTRKSQNLKLFIKGLPGRVDQRELTSAIQTFGQVISVVIPRQKRSDKTRGIAYVIMREKEDFERLIGLGSFLFNGKKLFIQRAIY